MTTIYLSAELRLAPNDHVTPVARGVGVLSVRPGPFGPILIAKRDGAEHIVPIATARALFGVDAVEAMVGKGER